MENSKLNKTAFSIIILTLFSFQSHLTAQEDQSQKEIQVGVILDLGSSVGTAVYRCITVAISDFYAANPRYTTHIVLNTRDTKGEPLRALSSAVDLLENTEVQAIIGPSSPVEARFYEILDQKRNIPILTLTTSPLNSNQNPYLLQISQDETIQFKGIAAMVESFKGKNAILICEDTPNGREMATYIYGAFQEKGIYVTYTSLISAAVSNEQIVEELYKLQNMQTTMFVIHTPPSLASNIFMKAKEVGMMSEGYMWIVTSKTADFLSFMDAAAVESMEGVIGFRSYFPKSRKLETLKEVDMNGIWAYDAVYALAMAVEKVQTFPHESLLNQISRIKFHGLGGEFKFMKGKTVSKPIEVFNIIGNDDRRVGFWMDTGEFVKEIGKMNSTLNNGLKTIIFPRGAAATILKRRRLKMSGKKIRIIVPVVSENSNLIQIKFDPITNLSTVSGYCGDVFTAAFNALNTGVEIEITPYPYKDGKTYSGLIDKVYYKEFDAAVGDLTITSNRTRFVEFTLPFSDLGIGTLTRNAKKSMWIFLRPLSAGLWFTCAGFFLFLGFVIWFIEHPTNEEFQGSTRHQIGTALWFAFSTLVYAHRQKLHSNSSRFVVTVWVFAVLVLTSSYTATLSSLLTVQQIASKGGLVQFEGLSPIGGTVFKNLKNTDGKMYRIYSPNEYVKAFKSGKVDIIVDEILYIKTVLSFYLTSGFSLVATAPATNGFGFVFQKGSPWTKEMSSEIAKLREDGTLKRLEDKWLKRPSSRMPTDFFYPPPTTLNLYGLRGLFLISGLSMVLSLFISIVYIVSRKCNDKSKKEILMCILGKSVQIHPHDTDVEVEPTA